MSTRDILLFTGNATRALAGQIATYLNAPLANAEVGRFPDGETSVKLNCDARGADCFIIQSTCAPVNDHLMELLILIDCLRRASAKRITAVVPYFGYARQDRKDEGRVPITAKLVANMIERAGADRVLTLDLHASQIQGFFDIPVDHLYASAVMVPHFRQERVQNLVVASPDLGSSKMAWSYAKKLGGQLAMVEKRRTSPSETKVQFVIGDVEGMNVILTDDVIATGGSIVNAVKVLKEKGAKDVYLCAAHGVLAGPAIERLAAADVKQVVITDTIPLPKNCPKGLFQVVSVAELFGEAIRRIHSNESVSYLFSR
ncbi:MAG: ribose-phosphate diphosphokinase [Planctomycetota bacterium]